MKYIKNKILFVALISLIIGCSQSATSVFDKDPIFAQNIQYSKVIKSIHKDEVNAIFNITYLNSVDSEKWDNSEQNFLIGSYFVDTDQSDYTLTMNGSLAINSKNVDIRDVMYKNIAFKNSWAKYRIVTFKNTKEKTVTLQYTHPKYKTISLQFTTE